MADLGRVAVLAGGLSFERDVSLRSGGRVRDALRDVGVDAFLIDVGPDLLARLADDPPDAAFVALHGAPGEDGSVRGLLALAGVPTVGTPPDACRASWDKPVARALLECAGLPVAPGVALDENTIRDYGADDVLALIERRLRWPLVVKPARGGSGLGAAVVDDRDALTASLVSCFSYDRCALVEEQVRGIEVAVTVIDTGEGLRALPAVEIVPSGGLFDYAARYTPGRSAYHAPARLDGDVARMVERCSEHAAAALGLRDLARVDGIVDGDRLVVLEVNTAPGMTELSLVPMALRSQGMDVGVAVRDLVQQAATRAATPPGPRVSGHSRSG